MHHAPDTINTIHVGCGTLTELLQALNACATLNLQDVTVTTVVNTTPPGDYGRARVTWHLDATALDRRALLREANGATS